MTPQTSNRIQDDAALLLRGALKVNLILGSALVVSLLALVVTSYALIKQTPVVIGLDSKGGAIPISTLKASSLEKPYVTEPRVLSFVSECSHKAFGHDFENLQQTVRSAGECFTDEGNQSFMATLDPLLKQLKERRYVMSITSDQVVVARRYVSDGVYTWEVQSPVTLHLQGTKDRIPPQKYKAVFVVQRVPLDSDPRGISLAQVNLKPDA